MREFLDVFDVCSEFSIIKYLITYHPCQRINCLMSEKHIMRCHKVWKFGINQCPLKYWEALLENVK